MPIIIIAFSIIAATALGTAVFVSDRASKQRYAQALAKIAALPLNERLEELSKARRNCASARVYLASTRTQFNRRWGYRSNPFFSALLIAQSSYTSANDWVLELEALCNEPANAA